MQQELFGMFLFAMAHVFCGRDSLVCDAIIVMAQPVCMPAMSVTYSMPELHRDIHHACMHVMHNQHDIIRVHR